MGILLSSLVTILISFDALSPAQVNSKTAPNIDHFRKSGEWADFVEPTFPSSTFPGHATLITGCWTGQHGIVSNHFLDPKKGPFHMEDESEWQICEPLWAAAARAGKKVAIYTWAMAQTPWHGAKPAYLNPLPKLKEEKARLFKDFKAEKEWRQILDWVALPEEQRPALILGYFPGIDVEGHKHGPFARQTMAILKNYDHLFGRFLNDLKRRGLLATTNIVLVSDHGMIKADKPIDMTGPMAELEKRLGKKNMRYEISAGTQINIYLKKKSRVPETVALLKPVPHLRVYAARDFPAEWHYQNPRSGDVLVVVDPPYYLSFGKPKPGEEKVGFHGYDPKFPEMHAFFAAAGSSFPKKHRQKMLMIEVAPAVAKAIDLPFHP